MELLLAIATILGGLTAVWFFYDKLKTLIFIDKEYFPDTNTDFYTYYARKISNAKKEIWITSDGFNMNNQESERYARMMLNAFDKALSSGVSVYRYQIIETMHLNWLDELVNVKNKHKDKVRVYVNEGLHGVPNACVIDPSERECVAERMEHRVGYFGQGSLASTYMFRHRDTKYAQKTKRLIESAIQHPGTKELSVTALRRLKAKLMKTRLDRIRSWNESVNGARGVDIRNSGVFDDEVISQYLTREK